MRSEAAARMEGPSKAITEAQKGTLTRPLRLDHPSIATGQLECVLRLTESKSANYQ